MKRMEIEPAIMVSGDNSLGQLWCKKETQVAAKFTNANDFNYESRISLITMVSAYNQSIAFCISNTLIVFRDENGKISEFSTGIVKKIACLEKTVIALLTDGRIQDCVAGQFYPEKDYEDICAVVNVIPTIYASRANGEVVVLEDVNKKQKQITIYKGKIRSIGATDEEVFIVNEKGQLEVAQKSQVKQIKTPVELISVSASETEAVFIDVNGGLWNYNCEALVQVFGLPPVVYASVGVQHFAAISFDGGLYTWGFNPSGQLGIGSDKPSIDPIRVLENIRLVCCGTHHTFAVRGDKPELPEMLNKIVLSKFAPAINCTKSSVSRAELLC